MRKLFENRLVSGAACAFFAMALALHANPVATKLAVQSGPSVPPDPWDSLALSSGPSVPPDPWDSLALTSGPSVPPDPWDSPAIG
jgi:hypothetical protein